MSLESLTVRRIRRGTGSNQWRVEDKSSVAYGVETTLIEFVIPSVCVKDGISDGLVNAQVELKSAKWGAVTLWVTQTAADVIALDD